MRRTMVFGYPSVVRFAALAMFSVMAVGFASALTQEGGYRDLLLFLGAAAVALAAALVLRTRVELTTNEIAVVTPWSSRRVPRGDITTVNWEPGSNVVLGLRTGRHVALPSVAGRDAEMTGAISTWLREGTDRNESS